MPCQEMAAKFCFWRLCDWLFRFASVKTTMNRCDFYILWLGHFGLLLLLLHHYKYFLACANIDLKTFKRFLSLFHFSKSSFLHDIQFQFPACPVSPTHPGSAKLIQLDL